ncbi:MAG TPA: DUF4231 domain-containing protein, partial [Phenylobacterium sp.]|jgi:hypothetical protein|nr:DUF4231 domain-containing protein [Phenylobacterium sp.]
LAQAYRLRTVLPFPLAEYRDEFEGGDTAAFDDLLSRSDHVWAPPEVVGSHDRGYSLAGETTVAQSDLLLAIWDGEPARGRGGTADVVDHAIRRGVPVIHLPTKRAGSPSVLWSAFSGLAPDRLDRHSVPQRPLTATVLEEALSALFAPPSAAAETAALARFFRERQPRLRLRPEYPLLLAATGVQRLRRRNLISTDYEVVADAEWRGFFEHPLVRDASVHAGMATVQKAFAWSDGLADHYAQTYRSALIFNYGAAALSVLLALSSLLAPEAKVGLLVGELALICLLITNTALGNRQEWHRRWLDYRQVAEQLRAMRSLTLLGAANPLRPLHGVKDSGWRWTDWYTAAIWRDIGAPPSIHSEAEVDALISHLTEQEVVPQVRYNRVSATRMRRLDHRLHLMGTALFYATAALGLLGLVGLAFDPGLLHAQGPLLTVLSAGLPTIGAALFGIRGQGDFIGASGRSAETADKLQSLAEELKARPVDLIHACRALENAAQIMRADLGEWRVSYRHRRLAIPA